MHRHRVRLQALVALACVALGGCSHQYWMAPPTITQVPLPNAHALRVAVVLDDVPNHYETSNGGHDFAFEEMRSYFKHTFLRTFKGLVAETGFGAARGFDLYVKPTLALRMEGSFGKSCFADLALTVVDAAGKPLASDKETGEGTFVAMADGGAACELALTQAIGRLWLRVWPALDAALAP